jgi:N utilization substance protein B
MSTSQERAREGALWVLYGLDVTEDAPETGLELTRRLAADVDDAVVGEWGHVEERVRGIYDRWERVNDALQSVSPRWRIERMAIVDRNILRLGVWEILETPIPPIVTINACVEMGKDYGESETSGFVNGLLDQLCSDHDIDIE